MRAVLLEPGASVLRELYLAITLDRAAKRPLLIFSTRGGVDIEQVAAEEPAALLRLHLDPSAEPVREQLDRVVRRRGARRCAPRRSSSRDLLDRLWDALSRARRIAASRSTRWRCVAGRERASAPGRARRQGDASTTTRSTGSPIWPRSGPDEDERERAAREAGVTYLTLDGDIGVLGNGAGLVMSTLDMIGAAGGAAADFCDVGGGARAERIAAALDIITSDARVRALLVNIFGGITRGDEVARGVLAWRERSGSATCPSSCASTATTRRRGREHPRGGRPARHRACTAERRRQAVESRVAAGDPERRPGMSILVDRTSRVLVQGMTGREGSFHTERMLAAGTKVVAGVTPGKGGQTRLPACPSSTRSARPSQATGADVSVHLRAGPRRRRPPCSRRPTAASASPCSSPRASRVRDMSEAVAELRLDEGPRRRAPLRADRPQLPRHRHAGRAATPASWPPRSSAPGRVGLVSRSGTLTYEIAMGLTRAGLGQSTCVGMGGDPVHGVGFLECLELFEADPQTEAVVLVGEIGGDDEERAAEFAAEHMSKPVVAYIAGFTAPPGRRMGHAGAIISGVVRHGGRQGGRSRGGGHPGRAPPGRDAGAGG